MRNYSVVGFCLFCFVAVGVAKAATKAEGKADDGFQWIDGKTLALEGRGFSSETEYARLPERFKEKIPAPVWGLSRHSAGIALRFVTDAPEMKIRWSLTGGSLAMEHMPATGVSGVDVYRHVATNEWRFVQNGRPVRKDGNEVRVWWKPGQQGMIYFPLYNGVSAFSVGIPKGKRFQTAPVRKSGRDNPVVFYGTSITQGGCASRPGMAFTAIAGRIADVPVVNLGFSGNGKMEPAMVDVLAEIDASVYVLDCLWNMNDALVKERFESFLLALRKRRPNTPILLAEDAHVNATMPTSKSRFVRALYDKFKERNPELWKSLFYLEAKEMLGMDGEGTVDGCHPNDLGMKRQGTAFGIALQKILEEKRTETVLKQ